MLVNKLKVKDTAGILCTLSLLIIACIFYYDTTTMVDSDSYVFPRAIIMGILLVGVVRLGIDFSSKQTEKRAKISANYLRSIMLIVTMAIGISLIPSLGFLPAIMITYITTMYLAMYEKWTNLRRWSYPLISVVVVTIIFLLFERVFIVQFPDGTLFY
ncbi:MAG: tripartite tricarboxylate transporter TctB family protein [Oceanospirillaceae bacterium]|nr:tripartite tricarboxylate transporter TctB family protein [Oceanospirillaceae bacterium]